jgi:hypothetical protein
VAVVEQLVHQQEDGLFQGPSCLAVGFGLRTRHFLKTYLTEMENHES